MSPTILDPETAPPTHVEELISKYKPSIEVFRECPSCPEMVLLPRGSFRMGDLSGVGGSDEKPVHRVNIGYDFAVGKVEVTQAQWQSVMGNNPSFTKGKKHPVETVSWNEVQAYLRKLNQRVGLSGRSDRYRLLSESEWEYAARAGTSSEYSWGDKASHKYANYGKNKCCGGRKKGKDKWVNTSPVGQFVANGWGLYDMHGNVWEWTEDCWTSSYAEKPSDGSTRAIEDCRLRVLRGGSWSYDPQSLRAADRARYDASKRGSNYGFRIAKTLLSPSLTRTLSPSPRVPSVSEVGNNTKSIARRTKKQISKKLDRTKLTWWEKLIILTKI